jgi:hypothetical protein
MMSTLRLTNDERVKNGSGRVLLTFLYAGILGLALLARFIWLDSVPGLNGDEAWNGLWVERLLRDHAWGGMTPSGKIPNFFLLGPLAVVQAIADPAPWVLRVPTVISDLAFVVVGVAALRSTLGPRPALIFALLAATAPITVMYSRIGWSPVRRPSQRCYSFGLAWQAKESQQCYPYVRPLWSTP